MILRFLGLMAALLLLPITAVSAANGPPDYQAAIRCASFNSVMYGLESEDEGSALAADFLSNATTWLTYSYSFGGGEPAADADMNSATDRLVAVLLSEDTGDEEIELEFTKAAIACTTAQDVYAAHIETAVAKYALSR